jgi:hypothetical protein
MRLFPLTCWLALCCAGCAGYRLGPTTGVVAGSKTVRVDLFQNQTLEPRLTQPVAFALRRNLQQEGTYRLATRGDSDVLVTGVITEFDRSELSFLPNDVLTERDYGLTLRATVRAVDRATGKVLLEREVRGRTHIRVGNDLSAAERQALPLLADDLARNVTSLLVDTEW